MLLARASDRSNTRKKEQRKIITIECMSTISQSVYTFCERRVIVPLSKRSICADIAWNPNHLKLCRCRDGVHSIARPDTCAVRGRVHVLCMRMSGTVWPTVILSLSEWWTASAKHSSESGSSRRWKKNLQPTNNINYKARHQQWKKSDRTKIQREACSKRSDRILAI